MVSTHGIKKYEKGSDFYKELKTLRQSALKRATKLYNPQNHPESTNPSTTVHLLVKQLINEPGYREED